MRGQAALEYMLILLLVMAFLVPIWIYVNFTGQMASNELSLSYAKNTVNKIASASDLVYSQGYPARIRVSVYIPIETVGYNITNRTINLRIRYENRVSDVFAETRGDVNGTLPVSGGNYNIQVEARDGYVQIEPV